MGKTKQVVPSYDMMLWPALRALVEKGGSSTNQELLDRVTQLMKLPEEVQCLLHLGGPTTEVAYRLAWARTYLKKVGAVDNSARGVWSITKAGRRLKEDDAAAIPAIVRKGEAGKSSNSEPEDEGELGLEGGWKDALLRLLKDMPADCFERLAQRILRESGFDQVQVTGRSGDGGIDGIGVLRMTLISFRVFFQCKRYKDTVSPGTIRDFRGAMQGRTDKGLVITTGRFTPEAKKEATRDGAPPIELIDGDQLCDLLKSLKLGVRTELVEQVSVEPTFFDGI